MRSIEHHTFAAQLDCRYLLHVPEEVSESTLLALTLHGYGSNPEVMLRLTTSVLGEKHIIAALQAPNQHYLTQGAPGEHSVVGYNWGTRDHWGSAVRLHHDMVRETLATLKSRFRRTARQCLLTGFSQPVGLNYRFAGTWPDEVAGIIGICGGVPRDWEEAPYKEVTAAILHIARDQDEFFPPEVSTGFPARLRKHARDVDFHLLPGGHRFPSKAGAVIEPWLRRVFGFPAVGEPA
jgi:predicted esterase